MLFVAARFPPETPTRGGQAGPPARRQGLTQVVSCVIVI